MIIFEFDKADMNYAEQISKLAEVSITIPEQKSFSSDLNTVIQIGVELAKISIPAVAVILVEMIKNSKKIKIKVSDNILETEGLSEENSLELAKKFIEQKQDGKAKELLSKLLEKSEEL